VREVEEREKVKFHGLHKWSLAFFSTSISALEDRWKKCTRVNWEYIENIIKIILK